MRVVLLALLALLGAVLLGTFISAHPGVVAISVDGRALRMSLSLFVVLALAGALLGAWLLRMLWRLLTFRARLRRWRQARNQRRALERLESGMLAMAAGDYPKAERLLSRGGQRSTLQYLAAAEAAHAQQAGQRRDALLALAQGGTPAETLALGVRRAEMLLEDGNAEAAEAVLAPLLTKHGNEPALLALRQRLLRRLSRFDELATLVPQLRKKKLLPAAQLDELDVELALRLLGAADSSAALAETWSRLARGTRENLSVTAGYAHALLDADAHAGAEEVLRKALDRQWDQRLVALYGELDGNAVRGALTRAERWLESHQDDPALLLALGHLCLRQSLWGKARAYLEVLVREAPSPLAWRLLAEACDALGDTALAQAHRAQGLDAATRTAQGPAALPRGA